MCIVAGHHATCSCRVQIEPRYVNLTETCFVATPEKIAAACDKNTIGVVGILGTTYSGHYEDLAGIDAAISAFLSPSIPFMLRLFCSSCGCCQHRCCHKWGFITPATFCCYASKLLLIIARHVIVDQAHCQSTLCGISVLLI